MLKFLKSLKPRKRLLVSLHIICINAKKHAQSMVEYGLIIALVSIVVISMMLNFGQQWKILTGALTQRIQQANQIAQQT